MSFTDWTALGVFPLQDHEEGVPIGMRQCIVGGRLAKLSDPSEDGSPSGSMAEYGNEDDKGTLGDVHPWVFWQTEDRGKRPMGSWSQSWAVQTVGGGDGGFKNGQTGHPVTSSTVLPMFGDVLTDPRYKELKPAWSGCLPTNPRGVLMTVMPGTDEEKQREHLMHADPRLFSVNIGGPSESGSLVCDLQPEAEPCMDKSKDPGVGGRHARLQSMMRVIALPERKGGIPDLKTGPGNSLAWNLSLSGIDRLAGAGMVYAPVGQGTSGPITPRKPKQGPITPRPPVQGPITPRPPTASASLGAGWRSGPMGAPTTEGPPARSESSSGAPGKDPRDPSSYGKFEKSAGKGHGVAFFEHSLAYGPFTAGHQEDQHRFGEDRDGHPLNSGHIATGAYFYRGQKEDGPLLFEGEYPDPPGMPLKSRVHLTWDAGYKHPWLKGAKDGMWRWYAEVPECCPGGEPPTRRHLPPKKPKTPSTPGTPGPTTPRPPAPGTPSTPSPTTPSTPRSGGGGRASSGPITPAAGAGVPPRGGGWRTGPTSGFGRGSRGPEKSNFGVGNGSRDDPPWGVVETVGSTTSEDHALYAIHHPMLESFAEIALRPQRMVLGAAAFTHNPQFSGDMHEADELSRPQVLVMRAWGGHVGDDWDYVEVPEYSRARGGTAHGGVLFTPPHLEMEDYFRLNSATNLNTLRTVSYVAAAPGVGFALGTPSLDGGMDPKSVVIAQDPTDSTNGSLLLRQVDSSGTQVDILAARVDQSSGEVFAEFGGTAGLRIPRGTDGQRKTSPSGGEVRINSSGSADVFEFWDDQGSAWTSPGGGGITSTINFTDGDAQDHEVEIADGIITAWTIT